VSQPPHRTRARAPDRRELGRFQLAKWVVGEPEGACEQEPIVGNDRITIIS